MSFCVGSQAAHFETFSGEHNICSICENICSFIHLICPSSPLSSFLMCLCLYPQFDHPFVEVHRVRKFRFEPERHILVSLEDLSEPATKTGYSTPLGSWSCDGEILPEVAIQVR